MPETQIQQWPVPESTSQFESRLKPPLQQLIYFTPQGRSLGKLSRAPIFSAGRTFTKRNNDRVNIFFHLRFCTRHVGAGEFQDARVDTLPRCLPFAHCNADWVS